MLTTTFLCFAAPLLAPPLVDELLPETSEGWRYERIELPFSFAPDLPYKGFEELRFAPGMFEPGTAGYWSYALALKTEASVAMGAPEIESFLTGYYGGLCAAVAESREIDFDRTSVQVSVVDHGSIYVATIGLIDAFVTGEPLTLRMELSVFQGPSSTELMAIASPAEPDAEIWGELRDVQNRWRAARPSEAFLNHLYFAPDAETYAALSAASFLREGFAAHEERTTTRPDMTYSGLYFYGMDTYFEFLEPADGASNEVGGSGVAFGLEESGATAKVQVALKASGVPSFPGPTSRDLGDTSVLWFHALGLQRAHAESALQLFCLEYDRQFLDTWHSELPPEQPGISRRQVLARYAALLGQSDVHGSGLFKDITEVHLSLDQHEQKSFTAAARSFGYERTANTGTVEWRGPRITFVVQPSEGPGGVTGFKADLRRSVEPKTLHFGRASLRLNGSSATFELPR